MDRDVASDEPWGFRPGTFKALRQIDEILDQVTPLFRNGKYQEALPLARQALELALTFLDAEHPKLGLCYNNVAVLLGALGDLRGAGDYLERTLAAYEAYDGPRSPLLIEPLNNYGLLLQERGELEAARLRHERALHLCEEVLSPDDPETARSLNNLGLLRQREGGLEEARQLWLRALAIREKRFGPAHPETAESLSNLGTLAHQAGNSAEAIVYLERVVAVLERNLGPDHPHTAGAHSNIAMVLQEVGDREGARRSLERALAGRTASLGPRHPLTAQSLNNLGLLLFASGDPRAAIPYFTEAHAIFKEVLGPAHPDTSKPLNNLGAVCQEIADPAARGYCEAALAVRRQALGLDHPETARSLNNLAVVLTALGDRQSALGRHQEALAVREKVLGPDHPETAQSRHNLGGLLFALGRVEEAMPYFRGAAAIEERLLGQIFAVASEAQRMAFLATLRNQWDALLSFAWQSPGLPDAVPWMLDIILRRKGITAEALAAQRDAVLAGRYPQAAPRLRELDGLRARIARKALAGAGPEGWPRHREQLEQLAHERDKLEAELARQVPEMNVTPQLESIDHRRVADSLPSGSALVEYLRFDVFDFKAMHSRGDPRWQPARYLAFVLPAGRPDQVRMIDLGEAEPIDRLVADFRAGLVRAAGRELSPAGPTAASGTAGASLRARVFDPLLPALADRTTLFLAPDGDVTRLPFGVLPTDDGRLLIDRYSFRYLTTGRDVLRFGVRSGRRPADPLVIANPDFDLGVCRGRLARPTDRGPAVSLRQLLRQYEPFCPLPATRLEGEGVAAALGVTCWQGPTVLDASLKQRCHSPRILHLATHGYFLDEERTDPKVRSRGAGLVGDWGPSFGRPLMNPLLRSGLALAGVNTWVHEGALPEEAEDGLLTAEDVTGLDLLDTDLVVLSACETGLGEVRTGEGVFGLQRAFLVAGARALIMSLWAVPDEATRLLMEDLYARLRNKRPVADALREAQLQLRTSYPDPYFWGAFVSLGDPGVPYAEVYTT
jgi:CHAT domain-containing protein/tetratricopeptide (TPR) repeat protein